MDAVNELGMMPALMAGITLSAASGLRVFLPLLAVGLAGRAEWLQLGESFAWLASEPVLLVLAIAALLETGAYYVPLVDNLLDLVATPAAVGGGTVVLAALMPEMDGLLQWAGALTVGGGAAGIVQTATVLTRGLSTASSGGLANPVVATGETGGSLALVGMAVFVPIIAGVLVLAGLIGLLVWVFRLLFRRRRLQRGEA